MLEPKRTAFRKQFRGRNKGEASRGAEVSFGEYGLKSLGRAHLSSKQIEAGRRAIAHSTSRGGKIWIRVFPDIPVTSKGAGVRMGGGKGDVKEYIVKVVPGRIIFEVGGVERDIALSAFEKAAAKLPFKTKVVERR